MHIFIVFFCFIESIQGRVTNVHRMTKNDKQHKPHYGYVDNKNSGNNEVLDTSDYGKACSIRYSICEKTLSKESPRYLN